MTELVGPGLDVTVLVGSGLRLSVGFGLGLLLGLGVGEWVGVGVGVADEAGLVVGVGPPLGAEERVVYVPAEVAVTNVDCSYTTGVVPVPVPLAPFQQPTAHSSVPGLEALIPATLSRAPTLPSSDPVNPGLARPALWTGEMRLTKVPLVVISATWADTRWPAGHAVVAFQVGVCVSGPLVTTEPANTSFRSPGCAPLAASATPAVTSPAPVVMPSNAKSKKARRIVLTVRHLLIASRITQITGMNGGYSSPP
jgi:hypothetical protein